MTAPFLSPSATRPSQKQQQQRPQSTRASLNPKNPSKSACSAGNCPSWLAMPNARGGGGGPGCVDKSEWKNVGKQYAKTSTNCCYDQRAQMPGGGAGFITTFGPLKQPASTTPVRKSLCAASARQSTRADGGDCCVRRRGGGRNMNKPLAQRQKAATTLQPERFESDYIRHLQKQVYYLELEISYMREHRDGVRRKLEREGIELEDSENENKERLATLKQLETEQHEMQVELNKKQDEIAMVHQHRKMLVEDQKKQLLKTSREKLALFANMTEIDRKSEDLLVHLTQQENDLRECDNESGRLAGLMRQWEAETIDLVEEAEKLLQKSDQLRKQLDQTDENYVKLRLECEACEENLMNSKKHIRSKAANDLKADIKQYKINITQLELREEQERAMRKSLENEMRTILKDNSDLRARQAELLARINNYDKAKDALLKRDERQRELLTQLDQQRDIITRDIAANKLALADGKLQAEEACNALNEQRKLKEAQRQETVQLEAQIEEQNKMHTMHEQELLSLQKHKQERVARLYALQQELAAKDVFIRRLKHYIISLENRIDKLQDESQVEKSAQSAHWDRLGNLADSIQQMSTQMCQRARKTKQKQIEENTPNSAAPHSPDGRNSGEQGTARLTTSVTTLRANKNFVAQMTIADFDADIGKESTGGAPSEYLSDDTSAYDQEAHTFTNDLIDELIEIDDGPVMIDGTLVVAPMTDGSRSRLSRKSTNSRASRNRNSRRSARTKKINELNFKS